MAWIRNNADIAALTDVQIEVYHGTSPVPFTHSMMQFPPKITKDSKSANFDSKGILAYEPIKIYKGSEARQLGIEFEWVTGGQWSPGKIKDAINVWKNSLYYGDSRDPLTRYPLARINKLYKVVEGGATFRITNISVKYSDEMIRIGSDWWAVHTCLSVDLELAHKIAGYGSGGPPAVKDERLKDAPTVQWL